MRKVIFGGANSLDNYIARKDDAVDWIMWGDEAAAVMADYWKKFDTILMGRKTYEVAVGMSKGRGKSKSKGQGKAKSDPYPGMKSFVFSRTLKQSADEPIEIIADDAAGFVRKLKSEDGKDICLMGGGEFARTLFEADLIDEIGFNIHPVLLGSGIPLFLEMTHQIDLELLDCKAFKNGTLMVSYRVKHATEKKRSTTKTAKS